MSKSEESHTEPIHDTPAEKDVLIRAMEAAGYTLDTIESTDDHLRFFGEGGQTMIMAGWHECEAWLNGVVFDDPVMSDRVEMILHLERFVTEAAATSTTMRAIEDAVEQNDNQFDGIINNLPDERRPELRIRQERRGKQGKLPNADPFWKSFAKKDGPDRPGRDDPLCRTMRKGAWNEYHA